MNNDRQIQDNMAISLSHSNEQTREAGFARLLSQIPADIAASYWFPERSCKPIEQPILVQAKCYGTLDRVAIQCVRWHIELGRKSAPLEGVLVENRPLDLEVKLDAVGIPAPMPVVEDPLDHPGFARFIYKTDKIHPGAIKRYLAGIPIGGAVECREEVAEDPWLLLEDRYNDILDETGGNEAAAARKYLFEMLRSAPAMLSSRLRFKKLRKPKKAE